MKKLWWVALRKNNKANKTRNYRFALIIPVYNEYKNLSKNFLKIYEKVRELGGQLIIAEDGSTDGSKGLIKSLAKKYEITVSMAEKRTGRGGAIKRVLPLVKASIVGYIDSDLSVDIKYLEPAVRLIEKGEKIVVGNRYKGKGTKRNILRLIASKLYNFLVMLVFNSKVSDHQCGFKFFDYSLRSMLEKVKDNHWFFDTEAIILAQKYGLKVYELPVKYKDQKTTKVVLKDIAYFIKSIINLKLRILRGKY